MSFVLPGSCVGCSVPDWRDLPELKAPLYPFFPRPPLTARQLYPKLSEPSPRLRLSTFCNSCPTYSLPVISICSSFCLCLFLWKRHFLPSPFSPLCTSKTALSKVSSASYSQSSFPLFFFLGLSLLLFTAHYFTTFLLHDPKPLIFMEHSCLSPTSPSLTHSEASTTLFQNVSPALCCFSHSGPLRLFELCSPPFYVILLEKCSKILSCTPQG